MINLKVTDLTKIFNQPVLEGVNVQFSGQKGVVALIGDNGSGKTTLLKILSGQDKEFTGYVEWNKGLSLGFMPQEITDYSTLSGGQKKIAMLSELLYAGSHDVVFLDEPDNHLDMEGKTWLLEAIGSFPGLVIMISHDRSFLRKTSNLVWLIEDMKIRTFPFGYARFEEAYEDESEHLAKVYEQQVKEKKRLEELVHRFKLIATYNSKKSATYHNMIKRLERLEAEMVVDPKKRQVSMKLSVNRNKKDIKGKTAILVKDLCFSYKDQEVFREANMHSYVGERVALVAPNGAGKSTLIKLLMGKIKPTSGEAKVGVNINIGYYSQEHVEALPDDKTPLQAFMERFPLFEWQVKEIMHKFLINKTTMKTRMGILSGGQRSRLQLALFLYQNPDLLILDEPTNHLDIKSITALENFLAEFSGSVLLVSHDHDLVRKTCRKIYTIESKQIKPFSFS